MRLGGAVLFFALALALPASARPAVVAVQASADVVARGLEAQYQAALIRERRLADEREQRAIADAEARLTQARAQADQRVAGAEAALASARADYAALVSEIALRDAASRIEIEAYRAEAQGLAQRASPELLAAYQRFADGDRVGAWPVINSLSQTQARAMMAAAGVRAALPIRDAARARETMLLNGQATKADVLGLWEQVITYDPRDFWAQTYVTRYALDVGDVGKAEAANAHALSLAEGYQRATALCDQVPVRTQEGDVEGALRSAQECVSMTRERVRSAPNDRGVALLLCPALRNLASAQRVRADFAGARQSYFECYSIVAQLAGPTTERVPFRIARELGIAATDLGDAEAVLGNVANAHELHEFAVALARQLADRRPQDIDLQLDVAISLAGLAGIQRSDGNASHARESYQEALTIYQRLAGNDPSDTSLQAEIATTLMDLGDLAVEPRHFDGALSLYSQALEIFRRLSSADAANVAYRNTMALSLITIGDVRRLKGDLPEAQAAIDEGLAVARRLTTDDTSNVNLQSTLVRGLQAMGQVKDAQQDFTASRALQQESVDLLRQLAAHAPGAATQESLASGLMLLGDAQLGDPTTPEAVVSHREAVAIRRALAEQAPTDAEKQKELADALNAYSLSLLVQGAGDYLHTRDADYAGARTAAEEAIAILRQLLARDATNIDAERSLANALHRVGTICLGSHDRQCTLTYFDQAAPVFEDLLRRDPEDTSPRETLDLMRRTRPN